MTEFHVMSPLPFTMSAISQPVVDEYQVTMSLESDVNNVIGTYVVCFSAETNKRYMVIIHVTKTKGYNYLLTM